MRRPEIQGFVFITPPTNMYDFSFLSPCPSSGVIVQGGADAVVDEKTVAYLAEQLDCTENINIDYLLLDGVDHFYTNALIREFVANLVQERKSHIMLLIMINITLLVLIVIGHYYNFIYIT